MGVATLRLAKLSAFSILLCLCLLESSPEQKLVAIPTEMLPFCDRITEKLKGLWQQDQRQAEADIFITWRDSGEPWQYLGGDEKMDERPLSVCKTE